MDAYSLMDFRRAPFFDYVFNFVSIVNTNMKYPEALLIHLFDGLPNILIYEEGVFYHSLESLITTNRS